MIELQHLAPYLPYGLKIETPDGVSELKGIDTAHNSILLYYWIGGDRHSAFTIDCKPILRPFSDLENEFFNSEKGFYEFYGFLNDWVIETVDKICRNKIGGEELKELIDEIPYSDTQVLLKWHFDIYGLIEKGLAVKY